MTRRSFTCTHHSLLLLAAIPLISIWNAVLAQGPIPQATLEQIEWYPGDYPVETSTYLGTGSTVANVGGIKLRNFGGCGVASDWVDRDNRFPSLPNIPNCEFSVASLVDKLVNGDPNSCVAQFQQEATDWAEDAVTALDAPNVETDDYEFQDVHDIAAEELAAGQAAGAFAPYATLFDQIKTIERFAGRTKAAPVVGFQKTLVPQRIDQDGWNPREDGNGNVIFPDCAVKHMQCFNLGESLYAGLPLLGDLASAEGLCEIPEGTVAGYEAIQQMAPDVEFVVVSVPLNQEDWASAAAQWIIDNKSAFDIGVARFANEFFLERALMRPDLQQLCDEEWCLAASGIPYDQPCVGNLDYAHKALSQRPTNYEPMAYQFEQMRLNGIVAVKGAGHEGWKNALPYPDCSSGVVSVGAIWTGTYPNKEKDNRTFPDISPNYPANINMGFQWAWWFPGWNSYEGIYSNYIRRQYNCGDAAAIPDTFTCLTNNAASVGFNLSTGDVVPPIVAPDFTEADADAQGNGSANDIGTGVAGISVIGALALLDGDNFGGLLSAQDKVDILHRAGDIIWDRRQCNEGANYVRPTLSTIPDKFNEPGTPTLKEDLASYDPATVGDDLLLTQREEELLAWRWAYNCEDHQTPDTAPFHYVNLADVSNRRLNTAAAVTAAAAYFPDPDLDGVPAGRDNCLDEANGSQLDSDEDGYGNRCDMDFDDNGVLDIDDFLVYLPYAIASQPTPVIHDATDPNQSVEALRELDFDDNGQIDALDNAIFTSYWNFGSPLGIGPTALDLDKDGIPNTTDNCIDTPNGPWLDDGFSQQLDADNDGYGNICDIDFDGDRVADQDDVTTYWFNYYSGVHGVTTGIEHEPPNQSALGLRQADFDGDGNIDSDDDDIFTQLSGQPAGPSGYRP